MLLLVQKCLKMGFIMLYGMSCVLFGVRNCLTGWAVGWLVLFEVLAVLLCLGDLLIKQRSVKSLKGVVILLQVSSECRKVASIRRWFCLERLSWILLLLVLDIEIDKHIVLSCRILCFPICMILDQALFWLLQRYRLNRWILLGIYCRFIVEALSIVAL